MPPVVTDEGEPSFGDRLAIVVAFGSPTAASGEPADAEWCREEARSQMLGGAAFALLGALLVAWPRVHRGVVGIGRTFWRTFFGACAAVPDAARSPGVGRPQPLAIVKERSDQATLLVVTSRKAREAPFWTNEVELAGDMS